MGTLTHLGKTINQSIHDIKTLTRPVTKQRRTEVNSQIDDVEMYADCSLAADIHYSKKVKEQP
jgi:hypothetical protein